MGKEARQLELTSLSLKYPMLLVMCSNLAKSHLAWVELATRRQREFYNWCQSTLTAKKVFKYGPLKVVTRTTKQECSNSIIMKS
jgi:hypothetical protein